MAKAKRGPLSKIEAFYVTHNYPTIDAATIAVDLDRPISTVESYIKKNLVNIKKMSEVNASDQFIRKSGSTVMTENASTIGDAIKKQVTAIKQNCITKIKHDQ